MKLKIEGSSVLITGASSGIGMEFARQLAPRAKKLILVARREERLQALKAELTRHHPHLQISLITCDLADPKQIDVTLEKSGDVDILVNNAGMGDIGFFATSDWQKINQMIQVNVTALTYLTRRLIGPMLQKGYGGVLMVSSGSAFQSLPAFGAYSATKYFVNGLTEALQAEVHGSGVVVTQLCPGPVDTEFSAVAIRKNPFPTPKFLQISAERCAREGLHALERGKALYIPGSLQRVTIFLGTLIPKCILRPLMARAAYRFRSQFN